MLKHIGQPNLTALFAKNIKLKVEQFATSEKKTCGKSYIYKEYVDIFTDEKRG